MHATIDDWIKDEAIAFDADSTEALNAAIDKLIASLSDSVELLGFGECLHGGEEILIFRNKLFQRLVETHGYRAIAIESSFPKSRLVNEYLAGSEQVSLEEAMASGLTQGFGELDANRELVLWMRSYNDDPSHTVKLRFYGMDMPVLKGGYASPRQTVEFALDYLVSVDKDNGEERKQRIDKLLGDDFAWENPEAITDPSKAIGLSPEATQLRIETEDLIIELETRRPELVAKSDSERFTEALHYAQVARKYLDYQAAVAKPAGYDPLLCLRDSIMADNLTYIVERERHRGKVLTFAHNSHLQRGKAIWPWYSFWPVGSQLNEILGPRYAVIGSAIGVSEDNGIGQPEAGTLEARLTAFPGTAVFIPTHKGEGLHVSEIDALPTRTSSTKNQSYLPLAPRSFTDFDWLAVLDSTHIFVVGRRWKVKRIDEF